MILSPRVHGLLLFSRNVQILLQNDIFNVYWSLYFISLFIDFDFFSLYILKLDHHKNKDNA